jgi:hypothetical protein
VKLAFHIVQLTDYSTTQVLEEADLVLGNLLFIDKAEQTVHQPMRNTMLCKTMITENEVGV